MRRKNSLTTSRIFLFSSSFPSLPILATRRFPNTVLNTTFSVMSANHFSISVTTTFSLPLSFIFAQES
uniref:Uncharacterized protein n=1 Tax=Lotus japonicus TaxID=34305 RepID=I3SWD1_LOTJA|nr:unknown [Lotus japonicus]